jgi:protein disulfide-isomerase A1
MIYFSDSKDSGYETFKEFAAANTDKNLLFSYSTITQDLGARLSEFIGLTAKDTGAVRIINFNGQALDKYAVDGSSVETLTQAVADYKDGKLKAYYKSEPVPETNSEAVKVVVGDTFEEMVLNSDKYVLLEAYAPWCGHC